MSEFSDTKSRFSSLVISELIGLCSFILSHPLYFSYFVFFSPYLLKLISFLSPLFVTTSLVFVAFLAGFVHTESSQTRFSSILQSLQFKKDSPNAEIHLSDDLGIYETVFGPPSTAAALNPETDPCQLSDQTPQKDPFIGKSGENEVFSKLENESPSVVMEEKRLENFFKILDEFERLASNVEEMSRNLEHPSRGAKLDKVVEKLKPLLVDGSEAVNINDDDNSKSNGVASKLGSVEDCSPMAKSHSQSQRITTTSADDDDAKIKLRAESCLDARENLSRYGSMRRERDWERTLACKLYEERHNVGGGGGGEGMDSLWEAYEAEDFVVSRSQGGRRKRREKVVERECEEDEDEDIGAQLCCLQALKLSAGKMILGVGKPNFVKISKAIKGIGWLHKTTKKSKKVHNHVM